jgi:copper chaperone CopZ
MATMKMKEISIDNLNKAERKIAVGKWRKLGSAVILLLVLSGGVYAALRMIAGDTVASRFAVTKMVCPACVVTVKEITTKLPGVVETDVSLAAQDVTVKYREKQITPDQIKDAIVKAGYPTKIDGVFTLEGAGKDDPVVALVNGKPIFKKDVSTPLYADKLNPTTKDPAMSFFSVVGKEILLQAADKQTVVVQPQEVESEMQEVFKEKGVSPAEFQKLIQEKFGANEKYFQMVSQRLGLKKLIADHVVSGINDPEEKTRKTLEWVGVQFKDADVKIVDPTFKEVVHASAGQDDWKVFWPRMISASSELKTILVQ